MKEKNKFDDILRDKLERFSEEPPAYIWDGIRSQLAGKSRKKRIAWYSWSAIAALLVLAFIAGWYFNEDSQKGIPAVADRELTIPEAKPEPADRKPEVAPLVEKQENESKTEGRKYVAESAGSKSMHGKSNINPIVHGDTESLVKDAPEWKFSPGQLKPIEAKVSERPAEVATAGLITREEPAGLAAFERETINRNASLFAGNVAKESGWKMGLNVSPGYSSYSASHDRVYAADMTREADAGSTNVSGGFSVRYKTSGRWSFESGMYYAQNGRQSGSSPQLFRIKAREDFEKVLPEQLYFNTAVKMDAGNISLNSPAGVVEIENMPDGAEISTNLENAPSIGNALITQGKISQVFDMLEFPLYLRYLLVESKLDVEMMGGINAGVVVGNNAFIDNQYGLQKIGTTRDISSLNLSGTIGLGLSYPLGKHFSLAVEPRVNYYFNSISKNPDVNFRPYRVGIYTGLYYAF